MPLMSVKDLEQLQAALSQANLDYQLELEDGKIIVMGPSDIYSSEIGAIFSRLLGNWVYPRRLGRVFESSGGFILANTHLRAPDVSFVRAEKIKRKLRYFAEMVPDLTVEIKSQSDTIKPLEEKIKLFLKLGTEVGILIDPDQLTVTVYRPTGEAMVLRDGDILTLPELFPCWELPISELWPPEFE